MRTNFKIVVTGLLFTLGGYAAAQNKTEESLRKERANLARTSDPVSHTKIDIKISELLIALLSDAARNGNDNLVEQHLNDYSHTIQDAHQTMMKTGQDAHKHPAGFKDLEIALRKQQRLLSDVGKLLDFDQRVAVDRVQKQASDISDQLVRVMLLKDSNAPRKP